ncbi:hypothetical protein C8Q73DRAFT_425875 [Cubamyces lactineus]|nr:hypothetical protein C8Q73DRAFT_425875 [Cubamyces lactineus]
MLQSFKERVEICQLTNLQRRPPLHWLASIVGVSEGFEEKQLARFDRVGTGAWSARPLRLFWAAGRYMRTCVLGKEHTQRTMTTAANAFGRFQLAPGEVRVRESHLRYGLGRDFFLALLCVSLIGLLARIAALSSRCVSYTSSDRSRRMSYISEVRSCVIWLGPSSRPRRRSPLDIGFTYGKQSSALGRTCSTPKLVFLSGSPGPTNSRRSHSIPFRQPECYTARALGRLCGYAIPEYHFYFFVHPFAANPLEPILVTHAPDEEERSRPSSVHFGGWCEL